MATGTDKNIRWVDFKRQLSDQWDWKKRMGFDFMEDEQKLQDGDAYPDHKVVKGICTECGYQTNLSLYRWLDLAKERKHPCAKCQGEVEENNEIIGTPVPDKDTEGLGSTNNFVEESEDFEENEKSEVEDVYGKDQSDVPDFVDRMESGEASGEILVDDDDDSDEEVEIQEEIETFDSNEEAIEKYFFKNLEETLGYIPYELISAVGNDEDGDLLITLKCRSCEETVECASFEDLERVKTVKDKYSEEVTVHDCPHCNYFNGSNQQLLQRISGYRKQLGLREYPASNKFRNEYLIPNDHYTFLFGEENESTVLSEDQLLEAIKQEKAILENGVEDTHEPEPEETVEEPEVSEEELDEIEEENLEEEEDQIVEDEDSDEEEIEEDEPEIEVDGEEPDDEDGVYDATDWDNEGFDDEVEPSDVTDDFEEDDDEDLEDEDVPVSTEEDEYDEILDDDSPEEEIVEEEEDMDEIRTTTRKNNRIDTEYEPKEEPGATPTTRPQDRITPQGDDAEIINKNRQFQETRLFKAPEEYTTNPFENEEDLVDEFKETSMYKAIMKAISLVKTKSGNEPRFNVLVNERTREFPIVDIQGGIRFACVDVSSKGGSQISMDRISQDVRFSIDSEKYPKPGDYVLYVLYSDMVYTDRKRLSTSKNMAKLIDYRINGGDTPMRVLELAKFDKISYTTDKHGIQDFEAQNSPSPRPKPSNGQIAMVVQWDDQRRTQQEKTTKMFQEMTRKGFLEYKDVQMYMVCSARYIKVPSQDGTIIDVTIVEYTEKNNMYVTDGFGMLVGSITKEILSQNPAVKIRVYYELDKTCFPSPTIKRYIVNNKIHTIQEDKKREMINMLLAQRKMKPIESENPVYDNENYNKPYWKTYVKDADSWTNTLDGFRMDWRFFTTSTMLKMFGKEIQDTGLNPRDGRHIVEKLLQKLGYHAVTQLPIAKYKVDVTFVREANLQMYKRGIKKFSLDSFQFGNKVVDDNYLNNTGNASPKGGIDKNQMMKMMLLRRMMNQN